MDKKQIKKAWKKTWNFVWHSNSVWSWIVNIILAFILIKFIVYPLLGLVLATSHPIVAVVSESMEHDQSFDQWWLSQSQWYEKEGITKEVFQTFSYKNGFDKGDIMFLYGKKSNKIEIGDILVFNAHQANPIIHRVVQKWYLRGEYHFQTKGDHNQNSIQTNILDETDIAEEKVIGVGVLRIPFLGWIKIVFTDYIVSPIVKVIQR
jgi:signal peptidase I